jgi:exodeoxyribonuclease V alpha subunit
MPLYGAPPLLLTRNLFYTAVTRAQRMVILVGREDIARVMVDNDRQTMRYTGLAERLSRA